MSSELSSKERSILDRYLARVSAEPPRDPPRDPPREPPVVGGVFPFSVDDLVSRGNDDFYDDSKNVKGSNGQLLYKGIPADSYVGVPVSLEKCLQWAGSNNGVVATMPYLIAGLSKAKPDNYLRQKWHTALSEEYVGIDKKGKFSKGKPVIVTFHGGGILTPDRIRKAYNDGLTPQNAAILTDGEFGEVLERKLPTGESITLYTVEEVIGGAVKNPFERFGIVNTDFENAKNTTNGHQEEIVFVNNRVVIARAGSTQYVKPYFDNIKNSDGKVGNWHRFGEIDPRVSQGRVLFVNFNYNGLGGNYYLSISARFVVVAPEAQGKSAGKGRAKK